MNKIISLVYVKRKSYIEDVWLKSLAASLDPRFELIVVGHTYEPTTDFTYIPFWENGLDEKGLICHKKNLGVKASTTDYCLVIHADVSPDREFIDKALLYLPKEDEFVCPVGFWNGDQRALTWCQDKEPRNADPERPDDPEMYISGAAIFAKKETFLKVPWNESLSHGRCEDVELSRRAREGGIRQYCNKHLKVKMERSQ
jgi:hypothetical protein